MKDIFDVGRNGLSFSCSSLYLILDDSHVREVIRLSVLQEFEIANLALFFIIRGVKFADCLILFLWEVEANSCQNLSELLCWDFESAELVPVFEELLGIKSVNKLILLEGFFDLVSQCQLLCWDSLAAVADVGLGLFDGQMRRYFLEFFSTKDFIQRIAEIFPVDVASFSLTGKALNDRVELDFRKRKLSHVQSQPQLLLSDVSMSQLIEILHELSYSDSFLLHNAPQSRE